MSTDWPVKLTELFASMAGVELTHVPYKGQSLLIPDLLSGRMHLTMGSIVAVFQLLEQGRLRALAVTTAKRAPTLPDVPTFVESGYPRYEMSLWYGVFAPARIEAPLVARLNADLNWAMQQPSVAEKLVSLGIGPAGGSPAQFADYIASQGAKWNDAFKAAAIR